MRGVLGKGSVAWAFVACGAVSIALCWVLAGCGSSEDLAGTVSATSPRTAKRFYAKASIQPLADNKTTGTVAFNSTSGRHTLKVDLRGLDPTHGESQYYLWQLETPKDRAALETPDDMVSLASYRVGQSKTLSVALEPAPKATVALERGHLTHFLVTRVDRPSALQRSILEFDNTGRPPDLGLPIAEGTFKGSLVGAGGPQ